MNERKHRRSARQQDQAVCGLAAATAACEARPDALVRLLVRADVAPRFSAVMRAMAARRRPYRVVADDELARAAGTDRHQGVVATFVAPRLAGDADVIDRFAAAGGRPPLCVYLDGVGNPHNLGAIARTAAHFGVDLLLQADRPGAARPSAAAFRVAEGGLEAVEVALLERPEATLQTLQQRFGVRLLATAADGAALLTGPQQADLLGLRGPVCWLFGEERDGLSPSVRRLADLAVRVEGTGAVESLNVAATTAVVLAETWRQRALAAALSSKTAR